MLNPKLKLNTKIFNENIEKKSIRDGFGEGLLQAGIENENIIVLCADLKEPTRVHLFAERFPERYKEMGICEQNMASVASGMAHMGKIPFITSFGIFNPGRNWEQIRTTICYNDQPVKIISSHSGITVGEDGGSHQALEDIAITRVIPNMVVISPSDAIEARKATIAISKTKYPTFLRCARDNSPIITTEETPFEIGKAQVVFEPEIGIAQIGIVATGQMVYRSIVAAKELEKNNIKIKVINLSTIKPLDKDAIISLAKETKRIITAEDHQVAGGMGSAVAECLSENYPVKIKFIGIKDKFGQSGKPEELVNHYEINIDSIIKSAFEILK